MYYALQRKGLKIKFHSSSVALIIIIISIIVTIVNQGGGTSQRMFSIAGAPRSESATIWLEMLMIAQTVATALKRLIKDSITL